MFNKELKLHEVRYESSNKNSKISSVYFCYYLNLLQVFGTFRGQEKLHSFDMGVLGDITTSDINMTVSCDKVSMDQLDLILNELELIEPEFKTIKAELRAIIQEKTSKQNLNTASRLSITEVISNLSSSLGSEQTDYTDVLSNSTTSNMGATIDFDMLFYDRTPGAPFSLHSSLGSNQPTLHENDFQKGCRLFDEGQYEQALKCMSKFKNEIMDCNPYPYMSDKGMSITVGAKAYRVLAYCYKNLHRYKEALETLNELRMNLHSVATPDSLQRIEETYQAWKKEAEKTTAPSKQMLEREKILALLKLYSIVAFNPNPRSSNDTENSASNSPSVAPMD